jgi:hypothetical protein
MPLDATGPWRPDPPPSFLARYAIAVLCALYVTGVLAFLAVLWAAYLFGCAVFWTVCAFVEATAWISRVCIGRLRP